MTTLHEYDVPHWALNAVKSCRDQLNLPATITDRMIYGQLVDKPLFKAYEALALAAFKEEPNQ